MAKKFVMIAAALLLAICLLSGGCSQPDESKIKAWKDMIKIPLNQTKSSNPEKENTENKSETVAKSPESIVVKLYFKNTANNNLGVEERSIVKAEGIGRETMEELLKGPARDGYVAAVPTGTRLLDINLKTDGICIVDLSSEAADVKDRQQEQLMLRAIADTMGQFPAVKGVSFMINGERANKIGGFIDVSKPVLPDNSKETKKS